MQEVVNESDRVVQALPLQAAITVTNNQRQILEYLQEESAHKLREQTQLKKDNIALSQKYKELA